MSDTYKIVRFFAQRDKPREIIATGLTRGEASTHCAKPEHNVDDWFDGFRKEEPEPQGRDRYPAGLTKH